jgi:chromosome segregation protein
LKFTQLRLAGFKSFVDPTELRIDAGLTGIIGPNGCGKSNLLEALRWVMGATSAKSLRGGGMEDVIFAGTDSRPARNHAEVTLVVDNTDKRAPARFNDHDMLEVVRRITRGKGSDYKINGEEVRAKDVQLLFADAGTGANSPALVRQGQISELINAKPENRRRVLEEAAGVAGLRARRREAQLKLAAAETNLDRILEIVEDLDSRHAALQRQAKQAGRYRDLSQTIRNFEALLWIRRWKEAGEAVETARVKLKETDAEAELALRASAGAMIEAEQAQSAVQPLREAEAEAAAALRHTERARDQLERDIEAARAAIERGEARLVELTGTLKRESELLEEAQAAHERLHGQLKHARDQAADDANAQTRAEAVLNDADKDRGKAEQHLDAASNAVAQIKARRDGAQRELVQAERQVRTLEVEAENAQATLDRFDDVVGPDLESLQASVDDANAAVEDQAGRIADLDELAESARSAAQTAREEVQLAQADVRALEREISGLERLLASSDEGDRALDEVRASAGYEQALAAALGDDLEAGLSPASARRWQGAEIDPPALPEGVQSLFDHVEAPAALWPRLKAIGVVEAADLDRLAASLKPGQRIVTKDGALRRWDGFASEAGAPSAAAVRLETRNRLADLTPQLDAARRGAERSQTLAEESHQARLSAEAELNDARSALKQAENRRRDAEQALSAARAQAARAEARRAGLVESVGRAQSRLETARKLHDAAKEAFEAVNGEDDGQDALVAARARAERARGKAADARAALESVKREAQGRRHRIASLEREAADWDRRHARSKDQVEALKSQIGQTETELETARTQPERLEGQRHDILDALTDAEKKASLAREAVLNAESLQREKDAALREAEKISANAREARAAAQARLSAAEERLTETTERLEDATGEEPRALERIAAGSEFAELTSDELERRLDDARLTRERLGAVNLRADEEARELDSERTRLSRERDDLLEAVARLRKAVDTLSREGRARLLDAFEVVDGHFRTLFETLFGGGAAELRLTENDDPLEAGLEIFACPPGKKMETMSLMSGGEQALTATALIFAVFLVSPAPVCVLDEVDAPLDDANVDRYCAMLEQMRAMTETRFLVITHNPVTMSRMNRLFGVTMGERGVSQLVSVNLSSAEEMLAAE